VVPVRTEGRQEKRDPVRMWSLIELTVWVLGVIFRCTVSLSLSLARIAVEPYSSSGVRFALVGRLSHRQRTLWDLGCRQVGIRILDG